jgi:hypothetical protein
MTRSDRTTTRWTGDDDDARLSLKLQTFVPPAVLVVAWLATSTGGMSAFFSRVFLGMWIHELGHAVTAWWCGFFAFPGPWRTIVGDERSFAMRLLLFALLGGGLYVVAKARHRPLTVALSVLLGLHVIGAYVISPKTAQMAFSFGGDAGNLVFGPLLMLTFHLPREHTIKRRWLHWGFVVIGAFAFCDVANQWWRAAGDVAEIPFGRIDGVGLSDASKLVDQFGWSEAALVRRYTVLAAVGLAVFAVGHVLGVRQARRAITDLGDNDGDGGGATFMATTEAALVEPPVFSEPPPRRRREPIDL